VNRSERVDVDDAVHRSEVRVERSTAQTDPRVVEQHMTPCPGNFEHLLGQAVYELGIGHVQDFRQNHLALFEGRGLALDHLLRQSQLLAVYVDHPHVHPRLSERETCGPTDSAARYQQ